MSDASVNDRHERALATLHPVFRPRVEAVLRELTRLGWQPVVVYGERSAELQGQLFARGVGARRSWHVPGRSQLLRSGQGIVEVYGAAADIVDRRWAWSGPCADKGHAFWNALGTAAKAHGLEWGGDWSIRDVAHVQIRFVEGREMHSAWC